MAITYLDNVDLKQNQLLNAIVQVLSVAPSSPLQGQIYYSSALGTLMQWNGSAWVSLDATKATNIPLTALTTIAANTLLGNNGGTAATPSALTATQAKALLAISTSDVSGLAAAITGTNLNSFAAPTANVSANGFNITNLAAPVNGTDAANKSYVDSAAQSAASGLDPKDAAVVATTANITLSGTQTIDGVAVTVGQRVLVKNQTTSSQNGIYVCNTGAWQLASDSVQGELTSGALILAVQGTTQAGTQWYLQTADPITVGTTNLTFTQFGAAGTYTASANGGLSLTGSAFSVKTTTGLYTDGSGLHVNTANFLQKYSANVGDGSSTSIVVTHGLGTQDVSVTLRNNISPYDIQYASVQCTTSNTITIGFATAPSSNSLRVTVVG